MRSFPVHVLVVLFGAAVVHGVVLELELPSSGTKCVSEDLRRNDVVVGVYQAFIVGNGAADETSPVLPTNISVTVTSPHGDDLHRQENVAFGHFAFTTSDSGTYLACFSEHGHHHGGRTVTIHIDWRMGIAAKDWDAVAKKENLEVIEVELMKVETAVKLIHGNLIYLKEREAAMRDMSEAANETVAWYGMVSLGVCIVVSVFQVWYLRRFFKKSNII